MSPKDLDHLGEVRTDWTLDEVRALLALPFNDLLFHAQRVHRRGFDPNRVQVSTLLSIKTGGCPEDCAYCPQSVRYETDRRARRPDGPRRRRRCGPRGARGRRDPFLHGRRLPQSETEAARAHQGDGPRSAGARPRDLRDARHADAGAGARLKDAGLDYYNHNLDTSEAFYGEIITTRTYQDRLDTLAAVRAAGMNVCCGGILGMGETELDRAQLLHTLATLPQHPESVPINQLVQVEGTPLNGLPPLDPLDLVRTIATARLLMPRSYLRLSAGRTDMSESVQALCFLAGANSIFYGERLLTTPNPGRTRDDELFARLGLQPETGVAGPAA